MLRELNLLRTGLAYSFSTSPDVVNIWNSSQSDVVDFFPAQMPFYERY